MCPVPEQPTGHRRARRSMQPTAPDAQAVARLRCRARTACRSRTRSRCEPCPERESIRHEFKDRDFVADQARDPFQSFVIIQPGLGAGSNTSKPEPHQTCKRPDQFVAPNYRYQDLKLVGIVAQGDPAQGADDGHGDRRLHHQARRLRRQREGRRQGHRHRLRHVRGRGRSRYASGPPTETSVQLHPGGARDEPPPLAADPTSPTPVVHRRCVAAAGRSADGAAAEA